MKKTTKQKLIEKLYREHGIVLNAEKMHSWRRNGFGSRILSWSTVGQHKVDKPDGLSKNYQSFETMSTLLKYPTKIVRRGCDMAETIEINLDKQP